MCTGFKQEQVNSKRRECRAERTLVTSLTGPKPGFVIIFSPNLKLNRAALLGSSRRFWAKIMLLKAITVNFQREIKDEACLKVRSSRRSSVPSETRDLVVFVAVRNKYVLQHLIAAVCCCPDPQRSIQI